MAQKSVKFNLLFIAIQASKGLFFRSTADMQLWVDNEIELTTKAREETFLLLCFYHLEWEQCGRLVLATLRH